MARACLGDVDAALANLAYVAQAHDVLFVSLPVDRPFDPDRQDPRCLALARRHHLPILPAHDGSTAR